MNQERIPKELSPTTEALVEIQNLVRNHFGWSESDDIASAKELLIRIEESPIQKWTRKNRLTSLSRIRRSLVTKKPKIAVLGAAIEPHEVVRALESSETLVAADGASGVLSELPSTLSERAWSSMACIVSDADGGEGTIQAVKRSVPIVLHAHGDNRENWKSLIEIAETQKTPPDLILTHQTSCEIEGMHNPGGFTDGDRAACFLTALGVRTSNISILGTRSDKVGRWSGETLEHQKIEKLSWMKKSLTIMQLWQD